MYVAFRTKKIPGARAQAIVEFAIVLPILLMMLLGVLEVGRLIFIYAAITNASRDASRFASAAGLDDDGYYKYKHCEGIRKMAERVTFFVNPTIDIRYDKGPNDPIYADGHGPDNDTEWNSLPSCSASSGEDSGVSVSSGDRVLVKVKTSYATLVKLIPIKPRDIEASSARTILGIFDLESGIGSVPSGGGGGGGGGGGTGGGGSSNTPTATATGTPATETATATATATSIGPYETLVFDTPTATSIYTPTDTATPTSTFTPTATSTPVPGCDRIEASNVSVSGSSLRVTIRNPHEALTISSVRVTWNHDLGGGGAKPALELQTILLGVHTWTIFDNGPTVTFVPVPEMVIPGNNITSTLAFAFNKGYQNVDGTEAVLVNFSTAGCEAYSIQRPQPTATPTLPPTFTPTFTPTLAP